MSALCPSRVYICEKGCWCPTTKHISFYSPFPTTFNCRVLEKKIARGAQYKFSINGTFMFICKPDKRDTWQLNVSTEEMWAPTKTIIFKYVNCY